MVNPHNYTNYEHMNANSVISIKKKKKPNHNREISNSSLSMVMVMSNLMTKRKGKTKHTSLNPSSKKSKY